MDKENNSQARQGPVITLWSCSSSFMITFLFDSINTQSSPEDQNNYYWNKSSARDDGIAIEILGRVCKGTVSIYQG